MDIKPLILASGSPRRKEILSDLSLIFQVIPAKNLDETALKGESVHSAAKRLSLLKGKEVAGNNKGSLVISADTLVSLDSELLGKPVDEENAREMLKKLSGKMHQVVTGVAFIDESEKLEKVITCETKLNFKKLSQGDIDNYIAIGEYAGKAGAYAIQGHGRGLIESYQGSFSNVVGFPVTEFLKFASSYGLDRLPWN